MAIDLESRTAEQKQELEEYDKKLYNESPCPHRMPNKHCPRQCLGAIICSSINLQ